MFTKGECLGLSCRFYKLRPDMICFKEGVLPKCSPALKRKRELMDLAAPDLYEVCKYAKEVVGAFAEYNENCKTSPPPPLMIAGVKVMIERFNQLNDKALRKAEGK